MYIFNETDGKTLYFAKLQSIGILKTGDWFFPKVHQNYSVHENWLRSIDSYRILQIVWQLQIWIKESLWDSVKIHWILVNIEPLIFFSGAYIMTEIQWTFTDSQRLPLIQI